jgi:NADPH:quinone reductase-like Zn-dependent oxidoreductase
VKAIVYEEYGPPDVLHLAEIAKPSAKDDKALISVYAASVNSRDWRLMRANPFFIRLMTGGLLKPKTTILGADMAGRIETVGINVR